MKTSVQIEKIIYRDLTLINELVLLWDKSVRASHDFLSEAAILSLKPYVKEGLAEIENLIVVKIDNVIVGFMGIFADKIEMLFILPQYFRKGLGKKLIVYGMTEYGVRYVDVNEQNPQAKVFYEQVGFSVYQREPFDEQGNPFPILKMKLKSS